MNINPSSPSFLHLPRDDSGYGSPLLQQEYSSPPPSTNYYAYPHSYHSHLTYANTSFHPYDQTLAHPNIYSGISLVNPDLSLSPTPTSSTPSKDVIENHSIAPSDYKIHWGSY